MSDLESLKKGKVITKPTKSKKVLSNQLQAKRECSLNKLAL